MVSGWMGTALSSHLTLNIKDSARSGAELDTDLLLDLVFRDSV